ncbi:thioredoxin reductase-like protein [Natrialba chahannaoensis JCM 10990]|uniref:Thioredoxin reductase-like protein n=1 Tax=Natrialba chahannaoensis JCM 10990 TaxID=1227492 RepID=M0AE59_9EURY|nr:FAD-binding protein [Natrialba chahannaoensis]ELY97010.1 thioredoxin reductase-like protein [Natrialba chahannaoensis JCM 10990]
MNPTEPTSTDTRPTGETNCTAPEATDEPAIDYPDDEGYHVVVVGGGPAGCAASLFCARAGLRTLQLEDGRSTLQKCAFVENYLGFPLGIEPRDLLEIMRAHVAQTACTVRESTVETIQRTEGGFNVVTDAETIRTRTVLAASWSKSDYLQELGVETEQEEDGPVYEIDTDQQGRTNVEGLYAAGRITGTPHQALVSAGDGARVALHLVSELIPEFYNDWVAPAGYYEGYGKEIPVGVEEVSHEERRLRAERGRAWMREWFDEESSSTN